MTADVSPRCRALDSSIASARAHQQAAAERGLTELVEFWGAQVDVRL